MVLLGSQAYAAGFYANKVGVEIRQVTTIAATGVPSWDVLLCSYCLGKETCAFDAQGSNFCEMLFPGAMYDIKVQWANPVRRSVRALDAGAIFTFCTKS